MHGGNIWAAARLTGRPPQEWIDFSASINPLGPPPWVMEAAHGALSQVIHYPDPDTADLVAAAACRHGLLPEQVRFGAGAAELIHLLVQALNPPAGLVLAPTFGRYAAALRLSGAPVTELPAWPGPPDPGALTEWAAQAPAGSMIILCNPNNPTGLLLPEPLLQAALKQERCRVVVDEAFLEFVPGARSLLSLVGSHPRLIVLRSLTKLYAIPGLRLGWIAGPASVISRAAQLQVPWSVSGPAAAAGLAALTGPDYEQQTHAAVARQLETAHRLLGPFFRLEPTQCNYLLARLDGITGTELQRRLLPWSILVRNCSNFTGLGDGYIRLAVRPESETARLAEALGAVLR